jgi:hypothetical protein
LRAQLVLLHVAQSLSFSPPLPKVDVTSFGCLLLLTPHFRRGVGLMRYYVITFT